MTQNLSDELLPCPFCGGEAKMIVHGLERHYFKAIEICCTNCDAQQNATYRKMELAECEQQAILKWNTRITANSKVEVECEHDWELAAINTRYCKKCKVYEQMNTPNQTNHSAIN